MASNGFWAPDAPFAPLTAWDGDRLRWWHGEPESYAVDGGRLTVALLEHFAAGELVAPGDGDDDHARDQVGHVLRGEGALDEDEQRE